MTFNKAKVLRQAEKHVQQGKINAAIEDYSKIAEYDPSDLTVVNTLGDLLVRAGRVEEAIVNFAKIAENYRENGFTLKAIAMFKKISKLDPQNVDISLKLATLYSQQGLLVEARQQYLQVADLHARSGKTQKALDVYQKIADLDPENTAVRLKLAETYLRENLRDQAHDAFVTAGSELIRKGKTEQGLNACLQALQIVPDSKQALTAVSEAYIAQGNATRAIELLQNAFDKNPGDVDLITILGRTYMAAGMMQEAEGTFTTLVQLDKSRFEYILELGRRYADMGDLDRAADQLDACVDVLISRREEDRAIDFLHNLLDRNPNHVPSLTRLADIYQRIREDHNLINTLESLVEAASRTGRREEAIDALRRLMGLEPENQVHRQRLRELGVAAEDMRPAPSGGLGRATAATAGGDPSIARDIADAARMGRMGDVASAIMILEQVADRAPDNAEAREHLRELYVSQRMNDRAAHQCMELARIYDREGRGDMAAEQRQLAETLRPSAATAFSFESETPTTAPSNGFAIDFGAGGFEQQPEWKAPQADGFGGFDVATPQQPSPAPAASDAVLRDELEGVDFYIAQGYLEIARDTLDRLSAQYPSNPEIQARYQKLKSTAELKAQMDGVSRQAEEPVETAGSEFDLSSMFTIEPEPISTAESSPRGVPSPFSTSELPPIETVTDAHELGFEFSGSFETAEPPSSSDEQPGAAPMFDIEIEEERGSGSIDLSDRINLLGDAPAPPPSGELGASVPAEPASDAQLLDDLIGDLDGQFQALDVNPPATPAPPVQQAQSRARPSAAEDVSAQNELLEIFEEFKNTVGEEAGQDFDTHYNLGVAYREMELLDDAIEEFQSAIRTTSPQSEDGRYVQCCNMLGLCFMSKDMPRLAVMWYRKALDAPNRPEDEYQAIRFDLGLAYEKMGDYDKAIDVFSEVYAVDINYRDVGEKLRELQALRNQG